MSLNLVNVFSNLVQKYGEMYTITHTFAPTYLNTIMGPTEANEKIVYVYIEDRNGIAYSRLDTTRKLKDNIDHSCDDLNLTGSPLKDNFFTEAIGDLTLDLKLPNSDNPWKLEEEYHKGICIDKVRSIISSSEFQEAYNSDTEVKGSVWFLCSPKDFEKTLFLQYEYLPNALSRGIVHYMGLVHSNDITMKSHLEKHYYVISKDSAIESHIENIYHIKQNISLCCSWTTASNPPNLVNLTTCDVLLKQIFHINEHNLLTRNFITQMRILMTIRDDILSYKESERLDIMSEPIYRCGIGIELSEVRESINKTMLEIDDIIVATPSDQSDNNDIEKVIQQMEKRRVYDLTDKLWEILKCCSNYKELKQSFNILFQCAVRCNIVNIPSTNKNRLAEIITEVANRRLAIPILSGSEPLEFLLEIGLEKLYKDYEYIFVESQIYRTDEFKKLSVNYEQQAENAIVPCNVRKSLYNAANRIENTNFRRTFLQRESKMILNENSNNVVCFQNSNFNELETSKALAKLYQIHCTLEHILMIHDNLNLPNVYRDVCNQLLNKPLRIIDNLNEPRLHDVAEIQLSPHNVRDYLMAKDPYTRHITIKSNTKFRQVKTIFYYNMENICPFNVMESIHVDGQESMQKDMYHCWLYRKLISFQNV